MGTDVRNDHAQEARRLTATDDRATLNDVRERVHARSDAERRRPALRLSCRSYATMLDGATPTSRDARVDTNNWRKKKSLLLSLPSLSPYSTATLSPPPHSPSFSILPPSSPTHASTVSLSPLFFRRSLFLTAARRKHFCCNKIKMQLCICHAAV